MNEIEQLNQIVITLGKIIDSQQKQLSQIVDDIKTLDAVTVRFMEGLQLLTQQLNNVAGTVESLTKLLVEKGILQAKAIKSGSVN